MGIIEALVGFRRSAVCAGFWRKQGDAVRAVLPAALPEGTL
jgi:hypothetical protein